MINNPSGIVKARPLFLSFFSNVWVFFSVDVDNLLYVSSKPSAFPVLVKKSMEKKPPVTKAQHFTGLSYMLKLLFD